MDLERSLAEVVVRQEFRACLNLVHGQSRSLLCLPEARHFSLAPFPQAEEVLLVVVHRFIQRRRNLRRLLLRAGH